MKQKQRIPNTLRINRKQAGLRQIDVAAAIGHSSTDRISKWEKGYTYPHIVNLFKLCRLYKVLPHDVYEELFQNPEKQIVQEETV